MYKMHLSSLLPSLKCWIIFRLHLSWNFFPYFLSLPFLFFFPSIQTSFIVFFLPHSLISIFFIIFLLQSHLPPPLPCSLPSLYEVVLQDVQTANHLGKDQDFVSPSQQFGEQLINKHKFTGCLDHSLQLEVQCIWTVALLKTFKNFLLCSWKKEEGQGLTFRIQEINNENSCVQPTKGI